MSGSRATAANRATARLLERGHIYFAYRPKIDAEEVRGLEDVERFYVILSPRGRDSYRLLVVGQKRLPGIIGVEDHKGWAFVEKVSSAAEEIEDDLDPKSRLTRTRGLRHIPAGRPAGIWRRPRVRVSRRLGSSSSSISSASLDTFSTKAHPLRSSGPMIPGRRFWPTTRSR